MEKIDNGPSKHQLIESGPRTRTWGIAAIFLVVAVLLWQASYVFFLFFAAVLFGLFLRGMSDWVARYSGMPENWALAATVVSLLATGVGAVWFTAPKISEQAVQLGKELPRSINQVQQQLSKYDWGRSVLERIERARENAQGAKLLPKTANFIYSLLNVVVAIVVVLFVGLYLAANPGVYARGFARLFVSEKRPRAREVLHEVGKTLQNWLVGRVLLMMLNGIVTAIALMIMGIPLALILGLLSGLLNFIPNFGPIIAAIPAVLIAFLEGPEKALYVVLLFIVYQNIDGYIFTPLVQKHTVALPPALTIMAQVLLGVLAGTFGVLLAVPLAAAGMVLVKKLYLEDILGEHDV